MKFPDISCWTYSHNVLLYALFRLFNHFNISNCFLSFLFIPVVQCTSVTQLVYPLHVHPLRRNRQEPSQSAERVHRYRWSQADREQTVATIVLPWRSEILWAATAATKERDGITEEEKMVSEIRCLIVQASKTHLWVSVCYGNHPKPPTVKLWTYTYCLQVRGIESI